MSLLAQTPAVKLESLFTGSVDSAYSFETLDRRPAEYRTADPEESLLRVFNTKQGLVDAMPGLWVMIGASLLLLFSLFLVRQASSLQKWAFSEDEQAPNHKDGAIVVWIAPAVISFFGSVYVLVVLIANPNLKAEPNAVDLIDAVLRNPTLFAPVFAVASIVPILIAGYKFLLVSMTAKAFSKIDPPSRFGPRALTGLIYSFFSFAASIATIISLYRGN